MAELKAIPRYVQAPEDGNNRIRKGDIYKVKGKGRFSCLEIKGRSGATLNILLKGCAHLKGNDWIELEENSSHVGTWDLFSPSELIWLIAEYFLIMLSIAFYMASN